MRLTNRMYQSSVSGMTGRGRPPMSCERTVKQYSIESSGGGSKRFGESK